MISSLSPHRKGEKILSYIYFLKLFHEILPQVATNPKTVPTWFCINGQKYLPLLNQSAAANNIESYSGFFEVEKSNLFFWFFPAEKDAKNKPLIVWLQVRLFFLVDINCLL